MSPILGIWASQISGRLWEPQGAFDALSTVTVPAGGVASITFAGIPQGYKHLQIRFISRSTNTSFQQIGISMQLNADTAANYSRHGIFGDGNTAGATAAGVSVTSFQVGQSASSINNPSNSSFGAGIVDILDYTNINKFTTVRSLTGSDINGAGTMMFFSGNYRSTSAITSINLFETSSFAQHSQFTLYGIR